MQNETDKFEKYLMLKIEQIAKEIKELKKSVDRLPCQPHGENIVRQGEQIQGIRGQLRGLWLLVMAVIGAGLGVIAKIIGR